MNALEYLERERKVFRQSLALPTFIGLAVMILSIVALGILLAHETTPQRTPSTKLALGAVAMICVVTFGSFSLSCWLLDRRHKLFIKAHPEMNKLTKWIQSGGLPTEKYPTTEEEKESLVPEMFAGLSVRGLRANDAFDFRDAVGKLITSDRKFASVARFFMPQIEETAEDFNKSYLEFWDVMVNTMEINPTGYDNPRSFREGLRLPK